MQNCPESFATSRRVCISIDIVCCALLFYTVVRILVVARAHSHQGAAIELQVQRSSHSCSAEFTVTEPATSRRRKKHNTAPFLIALVLFFLGCYVVVNYLVLFAAFSSHQESDKASQVVTFLLVVNSACSESSSLHFVQEGHEDGDYKQNQYLQGVEAKQPGETNRMLKQDLKNSESSILLFRPE